MINVFYSDSGPLPNGQSIQIEGYTPKNINGIQGNYKEEDGYYMFDYVNSKGNSITVETSTYELLEKVIK